MDERTTTRGTGRLPVGARSLDHYTRLVGRLLRSPIALVSVVKDEIQVFPAAIGLTGEAEATRSTPLSHSLCRHVVERDAPFVVSDARSDPRVAGEPAVVEDGYVAYAGFPLHAADGRPIGSLCAVDREPRRWSEEDLAILRDLAHACSAELHQHEEQLASSEALTQALVDQIGAAILFFDADDRLVLANEQARRAARVARASLEAPPYAGAHVRRADNRTPIPPEEQLVARALRGDEEEIEMFWFGEFGRERAVSGRARRLWNPDGTLRGTLVSAHDVTELARAIQVKESFVSTVSHELRTPLAAVIGYAELLTDELEELEGDTSSAEDILAVVQRRAHDLQSRIGDLLDMTDLRRQLALGSVDVSRLARSVVSTFTEPAFAAGLVIDLVAEQSQRAQLDERRITQVLENLLSNAVKYAGPGGRVAVLVSGTPETVTLEVADDGVGMTRAEADQAFDRFWRANAAHEAAVPGIGIGLSLVHDIVTAHHGTITLDSAPGEGTRISVELPRSPAALT